jgi:hypothetical protein
MNGKIQLRSLKKSGTFTTSSESWMDSISAFHAHKIVDLVLQL